jgi:2-hydroxychromene-2-carboxylate isomerase
MTEADIHFYFDPICPFAWMTSKWVTQVMARRHYRVEWRFISLRLVNAGIDYATHFPEGYEAVHHAGLQLLRVAAAVREEAGGEAVGAFYAATGAAEFDREEGAHEKLAADVPGFARAVLADAGLPVELARAVSDQRWDAAIQEETDEALRRTGKDVGTPIIHFQPPDGVAFFGPVISRLPSSDEAVELWDNVVALTRFPGFAELKRSLRERLQLRAFGVEEAAVGAEQDWQQGHLRQA